MSLFDFSVFKAYGSDVSAKMKQKSVCLRAVAAELIGMVFFVFIGTGTAVNFSSSSLSSFANENDVTNVNPLNNNAGANINNQMLANLVGNASDLTNRYLSAEIGAAVDILKINSSFGINTALAFGVAIMCLAYALGHVSGGQFNPAVTLSLILSGNCNIFQGICNILAQFVGSIIASALVWASCPGGNATGLAANQLSPGVTHGNAMIGEIVMTAALCFVVHMTCCDENTAIAPMAPLAIGFTVFLANTVLIPIDGCSINPARSFGPALLANKWYGYWIFVVGPFVGSFFGVACWLLASKKWDARHLFAEKGDDSATEVVMDAAKAV